MNVRFEKVYTMTGRVEQPYKSVPAIVVTVDSACLEPILNWLRNAGFDARERGEREIIIWPKEAIDG